MNPEETPTTETTSENVVDNTEVVEKLDLILQEMTKEGNSNQVLTELLNEIKKEPTALPVAEDQVEFNKAVLESLHELNQNLETTQTQVGNLEVIQSDIFDLSYQVAFVVIGLILGAKAIETLWRSATKW